MNGTWTRMALAAVLVVAFSTLAAVLADDPVDRGVVAGPHEAYQITCETLEDDSWVDDGIMHVRNRKMASVVISDHVAHAGTGTVISSADIDTSNGRLVQSGTFEIRPEAIDGTWTGVFTMLIDDDGPQGRAMAHGNGPDLEGMYVVSELTPLSPAELEGFADACGGSPPIGGKHAVGTYYRLRP